MRLENLSVYFMVVKYFLLLLANAVTSVLSVTKIHGNNKLKKRWFIFVSWNEVKSFGESRWQK